MSGNRSNINGKINTKSQPNMNDIDDISFLKEHQPFIVRSILFYNYFYFSI